MPGYGTIGKRWHADELALFKGQLDVVKNRFDAHEAEPCLATHLFEHPNDYQLSYNEMACASSSLPNGADCSQICAAASSAPARTRVPPVRRAVDRSTDRGSNLSCLYGCGDHARSPAARPG